MSAAGILQSSGIITTIDVFVDPSSTGKYWDLSSACHKRFLAEPECESIELVQDPNEPGHLRIVLVYKTTQEWYFKMRSTDWFQEFQKNIKPLWVKPPVFTHLSRVPWKVET